METAFHPEKITSDLIRDIAKDRLRNRSLAEIVLLQAWTESSLFLKKKINFRRRANGAAVEAYCEMDSREFELVNARQQWANWRTIPKNLKPAMPKEPVFAIDLCCGTGHSTEVLSCYLPLGSRILGLEYSGEFVRKAAAKTYRHASGKVVEVAFRAQSVLEIFHDASGAPILGSSVDLVNSSGAVGCHFDVSTTTTLAREVARVIKRGGLAMIDSGLPGTNRRQLIQIFEKNGFETLHWTKSCFIDPYTQVCFRRL